MACHSLLGVKKYSEIKYKMKLIFNTSLLIHPQYHIVLLHAEYILSDRQLWCRTLYSWQNCILLGCKSIIHMLYVGHGSGQLVVRGRVDVMFHPFCLHDPQDMQICVSLGSINSSIILIHMVIVESLSNIDMQAHRSPNQKKSSPCYVHFPSVSSDDSNTAQVKKDLLKIKGGSSFIHDKKSKKNPSQVI